MAERPAAVVPLPPRRVVSLVPSLTESLFDLGVGDSVVGATDYCIHPADRLASVMRVGGPKTPDLDRVLALGPDLVIANQEENRKEDVEALVAAGLPVWVTFPRTVVQVMETLWELIHFFQVPERGLGLLTIEVAMSWAERAAESADPVRVFCPIWRDPWMTISADTYTHDLLRVCGGENVFGDRLDSRYPTVSLDQVVATAPEVILLPSEPYPFGNADLEELIRYHEIPAVQNGRVAMVDGTLLTWCGTRLGRALQQVPDWLRPTRS